MAKKQKARGRAAAPGADGGDAAEPREAAADVTTRGNTSGQHVAPHPPNDADCPPQPASPPDEAHAVLPLPGEGADDDAADSGSGTRGRSEEVEAADASEVEADPAAAAVGSSRGERDGDDETVDVERGMRTTPAPEVDELDVDAAVALASEMSENMAKEAAAMAAEAAEAMSGLFSGWGGGGWGGETEDPETAKTSSLDGMSGDPPPPSYEEATGGGSGAEGEEDAFAVVSKGLTSFWNEIDTMMQDNGGGDDDADVAADASSDPAQRLGGRRKPSLAPGALQKLFPSLPAGSTLIESFECKLFQTYTCSHNAFTPDVQMSFSGVLYITERHTCFALEERGQKVPVVVEHEAVAAVQRERAPKGVKGQDVVRVNLQGGKHLAFKEFAGEGELDGALALLEHLASSD